MFNISSDMIFFNFHAQLSEKMLSNAFNHITEYQAIVLFYFITILRIILIEEKRTRKMIVYCSLVSSRIASFSNHILSASYSLSLSQKKKKMIKRKMLTEQEND